MTRVLIQGVPWEPIRALNAVHLAKETGGEVVWDQDHSGLETWLRVLEAAGQDPVITLEDDVILGRTWRRDIEVAIAQAPDRIIRFFDTADHEPGFMAKRGTSFYLNQCVYWPEGAASALRAWVGDRRDEEFVKTHDHIVGRWLQELGAMYLLYSPSLVQHRGDLPSTISKHRRKGRTSPTFEGAAL